MPFSQYAGSVTNASCDARFVGEDARKLLEEMESLSANLGRDNARLSLEFMFFNDRHTTDEIIMKAKQALQHSAVRLLGSIASQPNAHELIERGREVSRLHRSIVSLEERSPFNPVIAHSLEILTSEAAKDFRVRAEQLLQDLGLLNVQID